MRRPRPLPPPRCRPSARAPGLDAGAYGLAQLSRSCIGRGGGTHPSSATEGRRPSESGSWLSATVPDRGTGTTVDGGARAANTGARALDGGSDESILPHEARGVSLRASASVPSAHCTRGACWGVKLVHALAHQGSTAVQLDNRACPHASCGSRPNTRDGSTCSAALAGTSLLLAATCQCGASRVALLVLRDAFCGRAGTRPSRSYQGTPPACMSSRLCC